MRSVGLAADAAGEVSVGGSAQKTSATRREGSARERIERPRFGIALCLGGLLIALAGCERAAPPAFPAAASATADVAPPPVPRLQEVFETTAHTVIGISYPPGLERYPGLPEVLAAYSQAARAEVTAALARDPAPTTRYELSLSFTQSASNARMVIIAVEGSLYLGGEHSEPRVARFVWLPEARRLLTARELLPTPAAWAIVHRDLARQQREAAQARESDPALSDLGRKSLGTRASPPTADPEKELSEAPFAPVLDAQGQITALRFELPEGAAGEGYSGWEVSATVLQPHAAPAYAAWFASSPQTAPTESSVASESL